MPQFAWRILPFRRLMRLQNRTSYLPVPDSAWRKVTFSFCKETRTTLTNTSRAPSIWALTASSTFPRRPIPTTDRSLPAYTDLPTSYTTNFISLSPNFRPTFGSSVFPIQLCLHPPTSHHLNLTFTEPLRGTDLSRCPCRSICRPSRSRLMAERMLRPPASMPRLRLSLISPRSFTMRRTSM